MLPNDFIVKISNRDNSHVGYSVPELNNLRRHFMPGETKEVTMDELRKLSWTPGGASLLKNHFIIHNEEAVMELVPGAEPEYFYDKGDVEKLLTIGSLDQVKDALDFAPDGVVSLIKDVAVDIKVNDVQKRDAIKEATGFDVSKAIEFNEILTVFIISSSHLLLLCTLIYYCLWLKKSIIKVNYFSKNNKY